MATGNLHFRATGYQTINSFELANISDSPDVAEQIGDTILMLEERLAGINATRREHMDRYDLVSEIHRLGSDLEYPELTHMPVTLKGGWERYSRFTDIASLSLLTKVRDYLLDLKAEADTAAAAVKPELGTLEDGIRPMGATV